MGAKSILFYMEYLQLSWLGHVRRMDYTDLPRRFLTAWLPYKRGVGRPISDFGTTIVRALGTRGIDEREWPRLATDEEWWRNFISITDEERREASLSTSD